MVGNFVPLVYCLELLLSIALSCKVQNFTFMQNSDSVWLGHTNGSAGLANIDGVRPWGRLLPRQTRNTGYPCLARCFAGVYVQNHRLDLRVPEKNLSMGGDDVEIEVYVCVLPHRSDRKGGSVPAFDGALR